MIQRFILRVNTGRRARSIRRRIFLRFAELDPIVGTVFGSLFVAALILAMLGGVR